MHDNQRQSDLVDTVSNLLIIIVIVSAVVVFFCFREAHASGPRTITFNQNGDCPLITGWELTYQPVAGAGAQPGANTTGFSFTNTAPLVCGPGATTVVPTVGAGPYRFWLRAVTATGATSAYSNFIDANIPFAAPVLNSVN
jgi:hypothetical protein